MLCLLAFTALPPAVGGLALRGEAESGLSTSQGETKRNELLECDAGLSKGAVDAAGGKLLGAVVLAVKPVQQSSSLLRELLTVSLST